MIEPHGGELVDRIADSERASEIREAVSDGPTVSLPPALFKDLVNVAVGRYSPLEGFMTQGDFRSVTEDMTLADGTLWPLPIVLDVTSEQATEIDTGTLVGLEGPSGDLVGAIDVDDVYRYNAADAAESIYGTDDEDHPGVRNFRDRGDFFVGGPVAMFEEHRHNGHDLLPAETREQFERHGWDTIVGFQTRNAPHRAHEYIQKSGLELTDGILIHPKLGEKKEGDYEDEAILGAYETLQDNYYSDGRTTLSVFPSKMNYAGPREAVFDALVRKNHGCSHFIVGRDHAGVGDYYGEFEAQEIFEDIPDPGITPLFFEYAFYCKECDGMASEDICPHDADVQVHPSGTKIRNTIQDGDEPSEKMMRPEVAQYIMSTDDAFVSDQLSDGAEASAD